MNKITLTSGNLTLFMKRTLTNFRVTDAKLKSSSMDDHDSYNDTVILTIHLQRRYQSFWISLFLPSLCVLLASEFMLFLDETHFKTTIGVSLSSYMAMFVLYNGIQAKLPEDSGLKLIDIWLMHGIIMPVVVFVILATNEVMRTSAKDRRVANYPALTAPKTNAAAAAQQGKGEMCNFACKILVPITSIMFILTFFSLILLRS